MGAFFGCVVGAALIAVVLGHTLDNITTQLYNIALQLADLNKRVKEYNDKTNI